MAFCAKCGKPLSDNMRFCKYCGAEITPDPQPAAHNSGEEETAFVTMGIPASVPVWEPTHSAQPPEKKKRSALWLILLILLLLLVGAAVFLIYNDNYKTVLAATGIGQVEPVSTEPTSSLPMQTTESPADVLEFYLPEEKTWPEITTSSIVATGTPIKAAYAMVSSERKSMPDSSSGKTATYGAANAIDGNNSTAWVEGVDGDGVGEWIQVYLPQASTLTGLRIKNGYWKSERHLEKNTRVARILVSFSDGNSEEFTLADPVEQLPGILNTEGQALSFTVPHMSDYLKVTILAVYRDGAEDYDTCITEIVPLA